MLDKGRLHVNTFSEITLPVMFSRSTSFQQVEYRPSAASWGEALLAPRLLEVERDFQTLPRTWGEYTLAEVDVTDAMVHEASVSAESMAMLQQGIADVCAGRVRTLDPAALALPEDDD